jgi:YD repeat-containing protein
VSTGVTTGTATGGSVLALPTGGSAVAGLGERFAPDPFTGAGTLTVPITVPAGRAVPADRAGLTPALELAYSTATGNGPFGLGWTLTVPGITRQTTRGIPRYVDAADPAGPATDRADVFLLDGVELVPVAGAYPGRVRYRPRTEGLFARIEHVRDGSGDFWEVRDRDGLLTRYGTPVPAGAPASWRDPAATADPGAPTERVFGWRITEIRDPLGNRIRYEYLRDSGAIGPHRWDRPLLRQVSYVDYGDPADPTFLVRVELDYEPRPDAFSDRRAGFEIRTTLRCRAIRVTTRAADGVERVAREYRLSYQQAGFNGISLLSTVGIVGVDGNTTEALPPLTFEYTDFSAAGPAFQDLGNGVAVGDVGSGGGKGRTGRAVRAAGTGPGTGPGSGPGSGEAGSGATGGGTGVGFVADAVGRPAARRLDRPRGRLVSRVLAGELIPAGAATVPATQLATATGGAPSPAGAGLQVWAGRRVVPEPPLPEVALPEVALADPAVKLFDLDGDGLTDLLRSGVDGAAGGPGGFRAWFTDPDRSRAWQRTLASSGSSPNVDLTDPGVRIADMTGDGLADIVLLRSGNVTYWPNLGHGGWGAPVTMRRSPALPEGFDPRRLLLGDVDGDGAADLVYVDDGRVLLWGNQTGGAWTETPVVTAGTAELPDPSAVRLTDLTGTGMAGLLVGRTAGGSGRPAPRFLDFSGGAKPYLLSTMDNHRGVVTRVWYRPSTVDFLRDDADPETRWRTMLPYPAQVVGSVDVVDEIAGGRLTSEYRYRHGHWDGEEREFRGFGLVEQYDSEQYGTGRPAAAAPEDFAAPVLTRRWYHVGPVPASDAADDWTELDLTAEYWPGDRPMLRRPAEVTALLTALDPADRYAALRALRGTPLRTELYGLDGTARAERPYTVTETVTGVRAEALSTVDGVGTRIFFPFLVGERSTQWERGAEPMTRLHHHAGYDPYGFPTQRVEIAVPRGRDPMAAAADTDVPYLASASTVEYARRDDAGCYLVDRVARSSAYEVVNDGRLPAAELLDATLTALAHNDPRQSTLDGVELAVTGHTRTYYDGGAFVGLPLGVLGEHGLPSRTERLRLTDAFLARLYDEPPVYLDPAGLPAWTADHPAEFRGLTPPLAGYRHQAEGTVPGSPGGYYAVTGRYGYDVQVPDLPPGVVARGLLIATLDALDTETLIDYDEHDLRPVRQTDAAGLVSTAAIDPRLLRPRAVTDPNGNTRSVDFSPAGLVTAEYVRGKDGTGDGTGDGAEPSTRHAYDLRAFTDRGEPAAVTTTRRLHHDTETDLPAADRDATLVSVRYTDGFGRVLQTRTTDGQTVLLSGARLYDSAGRVRRRWEPSTVAGTGYGVPAGTPVAMSYDPLGRLISTVEAGSEQRVVFGVPADPADPDSAMPTPWEAYRYGGGAPVPVEVDALDRPISTGSTRMEYDSRGNLVSTVDGAGRVSRDEYDLAGHRWRAETASGVQDTVFDALGNPIEVRDGRGALTLTGLDLLHRTSRVWARDDAAGPVTLRRLIEYGDGGSPAQPPAQHQAALAANLLGRPIREYDEAGLVITDAADCHGNLVQSARWVIADAPLLETYEQARKEAWTVHPFAVDWQPAPGQTREERDAELLEPAGYVSTTRWDALGRPVLRVLPVDVEGRRREIRAAYDPAGELTRLSLDGTEVDVRRVRGHQPAGERAGEHRGYDHAGRLTSAADQTPGAEPTLHAHYLYDAAGRRVKRLLRHTGGAVEVTHFLNEGCFEHHRWSGPGAGTNNRIHLLAGARRVGTIRIGPDRM